MRRKHDKELDETFKVLSNPYRREMLNTLFENDDESMTYDQIIRNLQDVGTIKKDRKPLYMQLRHTHLPKMEEAGIIQYNEDLETVQLEENRMKERINDILSALES